MFNEWKRPLGPRVEVVAVDIPSRQRLATLRNLVEEIDDRLSGELDRPHALFGHSFGALVAYRLACRRSAANLRLPTALVLSSYAAPHLSSPLSGIDQLDDDRLAALLSDLGG